VHVFSIASWSEDPLYIRVRGSVPTQNLHELPADDLSAATSIIKLQQIDVLIYPELGLDPVSYWSSFQKLAPSQVKLCALKRFVVPVSSMTCMPQGCLCHATLM
jgi:hypothetical protein